MIRTAASRSFKTQGNLVFVVRSRRQGLAQRTRHNDERLQEVLSQCTGLHAVQRPLLKPPQNFANRSTVTHALPGARQMHNIGEVSNVEGRRAAQIQHSSEKNIELTQPSTFSLQAAKLST